MARATGSAGSNSALDRVSQLVAVAEVDTLYRDLLLLRAEENLASELPEPLYRQLQAQAPRLNALLAESRSAVQREDWAQARSIGAQIEQTRRQLDEKAPQMALAKEVYDASSVIVDPFCAELQPMLAHQTNAAAARTAAAQALTRLMKDDPEWADFYRQRHAYLSDLRVEQEADAEAPRTTDVTQLKLQAQKAAAAGDARKLQELADAILKAQETAAPSSTGAKVEVGRGISLPTELRAPFPAAAVERAGALGFAHVETKPQSTEIAQSMARITEKVGWQPSLGGGQVTREGTARLSEMLTEFNIPKDLAASGSELIVLFALHPFVNSAGIRYQFHFDSEWALVEDFPESSDPATTSELVKALGLTQRLGLARVEIERALRSRGSSLLRERFGLDPREYRLVCVPYDVYLRTGRDRGWGTREGWTHVDGYQLLRGGRLRALVAGHARYGGLFDLSAISQDDARESVIARFAVVRRLRMAVGRA